MSETKDLTVMNTAEKQESDPKDAIVIQMPLLEEPKSKVSVRIVQKRNESEAQEEPILQSMKDNIERAKILKDADVYMKKYTKANQWIMGIRLAIAAAVMAFMVFCTCKQVN